jgi:hypothetical protein
MTELDGMPHAQLLCTHPSSIRVMSYKKGHSPLYIIKIPPLSSLSMTNFAGSQPLMPHEESIALQ